MANGEIYEKNLSNASGIGSGDYLRTVNSNNESEKINYTLLAKAIIEQWTGSTLAGSAQSVKSALDAISSNTRSPVAQPSTTPSTITLGATWDVYSCHDTHFASLQMNFNVTSATNGTNIDVVTLPTAVKPSKAVYKIATTQAGNPYILNITTGGVLRLYFFTAITASVFLRETFTYSLV